MERPLAKGKEAVQREKPKLTDEEEIIKPRYQQVGGDEMSS